MKLTKASPYEKDKLKEAAIGVPGCILLVAALLVIAKVASSLLGSNNVITLYALMGVYILVGLIIPFSVINLIYRIFKVLFGKG